MKNKAIMLLIAIVGCGVLLSGCAKIFDFSEEPAGSAKVSEDNSVVAASKGESGNGKLEENESLKTNIVDANGNTVQITEVNVEQNDYAGGYARLTKIREAVKEVTELLDKHNEEIEKANPANYWDDENYFFLHFLPVYNDELKYTSILNERDDEDTLETYIRTDYESRDYEDVEFYKKDFNSYLLRYKGYFINKSTWKGIYGTCEESCVYDASMGALQFQHVSFESSEKLIESSFFEFVPLGSDRYLFQDENERMYVEYDGEKVKKFFYSCLAEGDYYCIENTTPTRLSEETYAQAQAEYVNNFDGEIGGESVTEDGSNSSSDSVFPFKPEKEYMEEWAFERGNFIKTVKYNGEELIITSLSEFKEEPETIRIPVK